MSLRSSLQFTTAVGCRLVARERTYTIDFTLIPTAFVVYERPFDMVTFALICAVWSGEPGTSE
jgi:hypothetical protein